ncbi:CGNR zinc finger domain-containing protein [Streptomyces qinzhouensis]|uniref:CGNR zinc finger domain-containing protein n=1 Tax=Streptomyces qinzhouensis TaxID=2599401 RepID=A0A5B8J683_9ACTN|nr:CGNR zinc finger domain-containing protein [Streptomyces qinzhouensis]QDY75934.1 CGNR zinc finger domain-containing protein [Streptomyces qinzhouensis]
MISADAPADGGNRRDGWSARHSVAAVAVRTAALVNVLSGPGDPAPEEVAAVLRAHGERVTDGLSVTDVARLREAAGRLRAVFAAEDVDAAAERLNALLPLSSGPLRLTSHGGDSPWHPHLDSDDDAPWGEWLLASSSLALTVLVWDRQRPPGGVCASPACEHVFLTQGSGPVRRYCSRRCATRERVAAHRRAGRIRTGRTSADGTAEPGRQRGRP